MQNPQKIILTIIIEMKLTLLGQSEPLKVNHDVQWNPFFKVLEMDSATFALKEVINTQESLSAHVWDYTIC